MSHQHDVTGNVGDRAYGILTAIYIGGIMTANAMAAKLMDVGPFTVTIGVLGIPLVYLTRDLLNELYGVEAAKRVV